MRKNLTLKSLLVLVGVLVTSLTTNVLANTNHTVGVAGENPNDYTVKLEVNRDGWGWYTWEMSKASLTFEGKKLYIKTYEAPDNNKIWGMQFHYYDGETWKEKKQPLDNSEAYSYYDNYVYNYDGGAWYSARTVETGARFYFDATGWEQTAIKLVVGHANYQRYSALTNVTNTKLYYGASGNKWTDAMHIGVVGNTTAVDGANWPTDISAKASEFTGLKNYGLTATGAGNAYLMVNAGKAGEMPIMDYNDSHETLLNSTQTIKYAVGINGEAPAELTSGYVPADIEISSYMFSSGTYDAVDASTGNVVLAKGGSNYSATVTAARTATTTYTVSNVHEDYSFVGWYDAASDGNLLSSELSYTFYPTSATTAYARFAKENNHEVAISRYCTSTSSQINNTSAKVGEVTYSAIEAPEIDGYSFVNWTVENGLAIKAEDSNTSNPIHVITNASGTYTMTANYVEVLTTDWKLIGDDLENSPFGDNYDYASGKAMSKKTGHSTESDAYITLNITHLPATYYGFKVATASGDADSWGYGTTAGHYITFNREASEIQKQVYNGGQHELKFIPDALGEYEFRVEYPGNKYVYVTFPTAYTVTYGIGDDGGTDGNISATYSSVEFASDTKIQSGKSVVLTAPEAKDGYDFKGWYDNAAGTGVALSTNATYNATISDETSVYAVFKANGGGTAIDDVVDGAKAIKRIENGQLVIIKNGVKYNALGAEVK